MQQLLVFSAFSAVKMMNFSKFKGTWQTGFVPMIFKEKALYGQFHRKMKMLFEFDFQLDELCTFGVPVSAESRCSGVYTRNHYLSEDLSNFCRKDSMRRRSQCPHCLCKGVAVVKVYTKTKPFPQNSQKARMQ
jgi:hypothetical protein